MHHLYLSYQSDKVALQKEREALEGWCEKGGIKDYKILEEKLTTGRISQKQITQLLSPVLSGDTVVVTSLSRLGRGINMLLSNLKMLHANSVSIITIDNGHIFPPDDTTASFIADMEIFTKLNIKIKTERSNEALSKARADGKQFGRPVGRKKIAEKNILYGKTEQLEDLYSKGYKPQKIAEILGVSRTTIGNYIKAKALER